MIYDFRNGETAQLINQTIQERIRSTSSFYFEPVTETYSRIVSNEGSFFCEKGEDKYLMFAFLPSYQTGKHGLPRFHITYCQTREVYSGFRYASAMPVRVVSRDEDRIFEAAQLSMCKNCKRQITVNILSLLTSGGITWYDYVLNYADETKFSYAEKKRDGYVRLWRQISEARRESDNWSCSTCRIMLNKHHQKLFLEVHHKDRDKLNNKKSNLQTLCVLCHGNEHEHNYSVGDNLIKVREFLRICEEEIKLHNPEGYKKWVNFTQK